MKNSLCLNGEGSLSDDREKRSRVMYIRKKITSVYQRLLVCAAWASDAAGGGRQGAHRQSQTVHEWAWRRHAPGRLANSAVRASTSASFVLSRSWLYILAAYPAASKWPSQLRGFGTKPASAG